MLKNEPTLAIVAVDTEENERLKFGVNYSIYSFTSLVASQGWSGMKRSNEQLVSVFKNVSVATCYQPQMPSFFG